MNHKEQARHKWVEMYLATGDAGQTCRRCGISRPTDRGTEFMAYVVQEALWYWRPNPPGTPHLNGKVERVQQTALNEFYSVADLKDPDLELKLIDWEIHYNITGSESRSREL